MDREPRMVADSHGTVWDSLFTVEPSGEQTELRITMDAKPHRLLPKLLNPLMKGLFRQGLDRHVEAVRVYCEARQPQRDVVRIRPEVRTAEWLRISSSPCGQLCATSPGICPGNGMVTCPSGLA